MRPVIGQNGSSFSTNRRIVCLMRLSGRGLVFFTKLRKYSSVAARIGKNGRPRKEIVGQPKAFDRAFVWRAGSARRQGEHWVPLVTFRRPTHKMVRKMARLSHGGVRRGVSLVSDEAAALSLSARRRAGRAARARSLCLSLGPCATASSSLLQAVGSAAGGWKTAIQERCGEKEQADHRQTEREIASGRVRLRTRDTHRGDFGDEAGSDRKANDCLVCDGDRNCSRSRSPTSVTSSRRRAERTPARSRSRRPTRSSSSRSAAPSTCTRSA